MRRSPLAPTAALVIGAVALVALASSVAVVAAAPTYEMSAANGIDVPTRTLTVDGDDHQVSQIGRTPKGTDIAITVTPSNDQPYEVYLYDHEVQIQDTTGERTGQSTARFSTTNLDPGTYFAAVYDGEILDVLPVVIPGYQLDADVPASTEQGSTVEVSTTVTKTERTADPHRVQFVLGNGGVNERVNATATDSGYVAELPTDTLEPGDYAVYAVVRGQEEASNGMDVVYAVSDRHSLTVTESSSSSDGSSSTDGSSSDGGSAGGGSDATATPNATATATPTASPSPTATETQQLSPTPSPSPTAEDVVTPSTPSATPSSSPTPTGQPGFGVLALLAAAAAFGLARRHR